MTRQYWGYRIDTKHIPYFRTELAGGILRQGWGSNHTHDLKNSPKLAGGAKRNLPIFKMVKKGDILLVPRLPSFNEVAIVEALEDFDKGYSFEISPGMSDYGHRFPAKMVTSFTRHNANVPGPIRASLQNRGRFWSMNDFAKEIDSLLATPEQDLRDRQSYVSRFSNAVVDTFSKAFDEERFSRELYNSLCGQFSNAEWEFALVEGLRALFPSPYVVERRGGRLEVEHGTDITITIPGLLGTQYVIAIQVKDYESYVTSSPLKQLAKADDFWNKGDYRLIDKVLIVTKASKDQNREISENNNGIRVIFAEELQELLSIVGRTYLGLDESVF